MLSLINIRIKYVIRHPCLLFWTYLIIPIIILIIGSKYLSNNSKIDSHEKVEAFQFQESKNFLGNNFYASLYKYWDYTIFLVDKGLNKTKIEKILLDLTSENIICLDKEKEISNKTFNIIKITLKDNKFRIYLTSRNTNLTITDGNTNNENKIFYNNFKFFEYEE